MCVLLWHLYKYLTMLIMSMAEHMFVEWGYWVLWASAKEGYSCVTWLLSFSFPRSLHSDRQGGHSSLQGHPHPHPHLLLAFLIKVILAGVR